MVKHLRPVAVAVAAVPLGLWLGEHPGAPLPIRDFLALLVVAMAAAWPLGSRSRRASVFAGVVVAALFCAPWLAGRHEAMDAFNDCVQNGERVRESLASYRAEHGSFPSSLAQLTIRIPGELTLPPHKLKYRSTGAAYVLSFSDWLANHQATDIDGFEVHK